MRSGLKSSWNIPPFLMHKMHLKCCFHFQHPIFVDRNCLQWQEPRQDYGVDWTQGTRFGCHFLPSALGLSSCWETNSGLTLIRHYGELYCIIYRILQCKNNRIERAEVSVSKASKHRKQCLDCTTEEHRSWSCKGLEQWDCYLTL